MDFGLFGCDLEEWERRGARWQLRRRVAKCAVLPVGEESGLYGLQNEARDRRSRTEAVLRLEMLLCSVESVRWCGVMASVRATPIHKLKTLKRRNSARTIH